MSFEIIDGVLKKYSGNEEIVHVPEGVRTIATHAFSNCSSIKTLIYPGSLEKVELYPYSNCKNLISAELSPGVKTIPERCFSDLSELQNVTIPEGVTRIEDRAFSNCEKLARINLPSSITSIVSSAFEGCTSLKEIYISDLSSFMKIILWNADYNSHSLLEGERELYINGTLAEDIQIPVDDDLEETGKQLSRYKFLKRVVIPASVRRISKEAFERCRNLREVVVLGNLEDIYYDAFSGCDDITLILPNREICGKMKQSWKENFSTICILEDPLTDAVIEDGETEIPDSMYARLGDLKKVTIPNTVTKIGMNAFLSCRKLELSELPDNITSIGMSAFANCTSISELKLPGKLEEINDSAFLNCSEIKKITIPASVRFIGPLAFASCKNLKEIVFESLVESIDKEAFSNSASLTIKFPEGALETKDKLPIALCSVNFIVSDKELAYIFLYQKLKTWKDWIENRKLEQPQNVFEHMLEIYKSDKKASAEVLSNFMIKYANKIAPEKIKEAITLMEKNKFKNLNQAKDAPEIRERLSGKRAEESPIESFVKELIKQPEKEILPEALKAVKRGLPYADSGKISSPEVVAFVISEYMREWNKCRSFIQGEISSIEVLKDGSTVSLHPEADQAAFALNRDELSNFLEGLISKQNYRQFLLPWARYATDQSVERITSNYKTMINGKSRDRYKASNTREALIINDTRAAMQFFDRIGGLDDYAAKRGMSAMAMRDSVMLPDFSFDSDGIKRYDIGGNTIEVSITPELGFRIYDVKAQKEIRSFPKKSDDPAKAEACAKEFSAFKKSVLSFAKERTVLIHLMHISGENVDQEFWYKVYVNHPVIKCLSQLLVWQDEANCSFTVSDGKIVSATNEEYVPRGKIRVAHVLDMKKEDISTWQQFFAQAGRKQLFDQIWEPIINWNESDISDRYKGAVLSSDARNKLKQALKQRGIDSSADYDSREYNHRTGQYEYSDKGTMHYGTGIYVDFTIDPDTKETTFEKTYAHGNPGDREINAELLELDKATLSSQIAKDNDSSINTGILSGFTVSQISMLLNLAIEEKAEKCTALLLNYKNEHFKEYSNLDEFSLDW